MKQISHGDFTSLADDYAKYRPAYSPFIADMAMAMLPKNPQIADIGAGTGIWGNMLAERGANVAAVEPNDAMRRKGEEQKGKIARWVAADAENTTLQGAAYDLVCMASSFHWPDFHKAIQEFDRLLKSRGFFLALWNTRSIEKDPLLTRIERKLKELVPNLVRVSSGKSDFCDRLTHRLEQETPFKDVVYLEGYHVEFQTPEQYLGVWKSVNDVQVQAGPERFGSFLDYIQEETRTLDRIEAHYTTRAWLARRKA